MIRCVLARDEQGNPTALCYQMTDEEVAEDRATRLRVAAETDARAKAVRESLRGSWK